MATFPLRLIACVLFTLLKANAATDYLDVYDEDIYALLDEYEQDGNELTYDDLNDLYEYLNYDSVNNIQNVFANMYDQYDGYDGYNDYLDFDQYEFNDYYQYDPEIVAEGSDIRVTNGDHCEDSTTIRLHNGQRFLIYFPSPSTKKKKVFTFKGYHAPSKKIQFTKLGKTKLTKRHIPLFKRAYLDKGCLHLIKEDPTAPLRKAMHSTKKAKAKAKKLEAELLSLSTPVVKPIEATTKKFGQPQLSPFRQLPTLDLPPPPEEPAIPPKRKKHKPPVLTTEERQMHPKYLKRVIEEKRRRKHKPPVLTKEERHIHPALRKKKPPPVPEAKAPEAPAWSRGVTRPRRGHRFESATPVHLIFIRHPQSTQNEFNMAEGLALTAMRKVRFTDRDSPLRRTGRQQLNNLLDKDVRHRLQVFFHDHGGILKDIMEYKYVVEVSPLSRAFLAGLFLEESIANYVSKRHSTEFLNGYPPEQTHYIISREFQEVPGGMIKGPASKIDERFETAIQNIESRNGGASMGNFLNWLTDKYGDGIEQDYVPLREAIPGALPLFLENVRQLKVDITSFPSVAERAGKGLPKLGGASCDREKWIESLECKMKRGEEIPVKLIGGHSRSFKELITTFGTVKTQQKYKQYCHSHSVKPGKLPNTAIVYVKAQINHRGELKFTDFQEIYTAFGHLHT